MARVLTTCPTEGRAVPTGHRMTPAQLDAAKLQYAFRCAACGEVHQWTCKDAWVEERHRY
jgi:hypothetical protein